MFRFFSNKRTLRLESLESRQLLSVSPMGNSDSEWSFSTENPVVSTEIPSSDAVESPTSEQWEQLQAIRDLYGPWTSEQKQLVDQFRSYWETLNVSDDGLSSTTTTAIGDTLTLGLDASAVDSELQTLDEWDAEQELWESDSEVLSLFSDGCGCGCGGGSNPYADWTVSMAITPDTRVNPDTQESEAVPREITEVPLAPNVNDMAELVFSYTKPSGCMASAGCMSVQFSVTSFTPNATTLAQYGKEDADAGDVHILSSSGSAWSEIFSSSSESTTVDGGTQTITLYTTQFYISPTSTPHLYMKARFDWDAEGLYANMTMQGGMEILHMQLVSAYFEGTSTNVAQVSDTVCTLPIHDGGILETFCDWDGNGEITDADAPYSFQYSNHQVTLNEDDDNANNQFDYLDTGTVSGEDDLLLHRSYAWISVYPGGDLPVTVTLPTSRTAHQFWESAEKGTVYVPTNGLVGTITSSSTTVSDDYYVEGKSTGTSSVLLEVNEPSGCQYTPSGCIPLSSENTFYLHTGIVDLDIDSDNNGYINTSANASRMLVEDVMELGSPKPITYRSSNGNAPEEFFWVPLRLSCGNSALVSYYQFIYNSDILEIRSDYTDSDTAINPSQHYFTTGESNRLSDTYYVRARAAGGVQHIKIQAYDSNNQPIGYEYDMVTVNIQDNSTADISDWVIPSGWTINGTSFKTPMPVNAAKQLNLLPTSSGSVVKPSQEHYTAGAIGPQNEGSNNLLAGSSASANMKKGDAFIPWTPTNGFTMEFDYSFDRSNGNDGYVRPDNGKVNLGALSEKYDDQDSYKASFVANSGIKIFGVYEIQIFDTYQMVERIKQQLCIKHEITTNDEGFDALLSNELKAIMNGTSSLGYQSEESKGTLVNGIPYGYSAVNEDDNTSVQRILDAATATVSGTVSMRIVYNYNTATITVYLKTGETWGSGVEYPVSYVRTNTRTNETSTVSLFNSTDPNIYIQSHWGSGVTFSNVSISSPE